MYFKVAFVTISIFLISGCSVNPFSAKPKKPDTNKLGVKVVEEIETDNTTPLSSVKNSTITPIKKSPIIKHSKKNKTKPYLKPEPFSLESDESDPELLGPQTTLDSPLLKNNIENNNTL